MEVIVTIVRQVGFISLFRGRISNLLITRGYNPVTKYHGHPRKHSLKLTALSPMEISSKSWFFHHPSTWWIFQPAIC